VLVVLTPSWRAAAVDADRGRVALVGARSVLVTSLDALDTPTLLPLPRWRWDDLALPSPPQPRLPLGQRAGGPDEDEAEDIPF
jgi:hypothetical protein